MTGFRVGITDGIVVSRPRAETFTRANYLSALANRADSFWVPDHLNGLFPRSLWKQKYSGATKLVPTLDAFMEPWTMLGHLAARNRVGRMHLGVSVTDTGRRNPAVTAQAAATLHLLTRGRAILGIGPGEREGNEPYGVDWSKPVARFEEAMATIRALWDSGGQLVNRDSPYFPLRNALFDLPPYRGKWPEIWIGSPRSPHAARRGPLRRWLFPRLSAPAEGLRATTGGRSGRGLRRRARPDVHRSRRLDSGDHWSKP